MKRFEKLLSLNLNIIHAIAIKENELYDLKNKKHKGDIKNDGNN